MKQVFGNAFVPLEPQELAWVKGLMDVTWHFGGDECLYLFTFNGWLLSKLSAAWQNAGMPGHITFGLIRSSNQAKKHLPEQDRKLVCEAMCHDVGTADRFYVAVLSHTQIFSTRRLPMEALEKDSMQADSQSSENSESGQPSEDDTGSSDSETKTQHFNKKT